tara:strand:+ start:267 stop:392 length:126 start_codon:yes stop_codon:yes gene_type:complete
MDAILPLGDVTNGDAGASKAGKEAEEDVLDENSRLSVNGSV